MNATGSGPVDSSTSDAGRIVRYAVGQQEPSVAVLKDDRLHPLARRIADLTQLSLADLHARYDAALAQPPLGDPGWQILSPVDQRTEIWAAGVTYEISQDARMEESQASASVYAQVYAADRPELFFKAPAWRAVGPGDVVRCRADSSIDVPEPELALLVNVHREVIGYGICNDMSSRSIEAENPLYLPQAKVYQGSCALGPGITPAWLVPDPYALQLTLTITHGSLTRWRGDAQISRLHRKLDDLVDWLHRETDFPDGVWLSTGTCLVPDLPFSLQHGDTVTIEIPGLGTLSNPVHRNEGNA